jgi:UDP-glucose 4-epimerase
MRILVTGSAGFIGSHLVDHLLAEGHEVHGIDNCSIGRLENVSKDAKATFWQFDLKDGNRIAKLVADIRPDLCYHLAAWAHEGLSQFMPILITENNYNAFLNLIVPLIRAQCPRVVVCSSMSVYGAQRPPFNEDMKRRPEDIYAIAKTAMEEATEILADVHGFDYSIVRPHNVYGPRQAIWDPYRNVVGIFINRVMRGLPPVIYGDGCQTRAFSYIDDVSPYLAKAGLVDEAKSQIINIGPLEEYTIKQLAATVLDAFGLDMCPVHLPPRPREVKHAFCTNDKAVELLGYRTTIELNEGIGRMVEWAQGLGPQDFQYLDDLELTSGDIPETWLQRSM